MYNQTPRHLSIKHIKEQGTINSKVEHWDYTRVSFSLYLCVCVFVSHFYWVKSKVQFHFTIVTTSTDTVIKTNLVEILHIWPPLLQYSGKQFDTISRNSQICIFSSIFNRTKLQLHTS